LGKKKGEGRSRDKFWGGFVEKTGITTNNGKRGSLKHRDGKHITLLGENKAKLREVGKTPIEKVGSAQMIEHRQQSRTRGTGHFGWTKGGAFQRNKEA